MTKLSQQPPKPRSRKRHPRYPRTLGTLAAGVVASGALALSAACNEVEVEDGSGGFAGNMAGGAPGAYHPGGAGGQGGAEQGGGGAGGGAGHGWGGMLAGEAPGGFAPSGGGGQGGDVGGAGGK